MTVKFILNLKSYFRKISLKVFQKPMNTFSELRIIFFSEKTSTTYLYTRI